MTLLHPSVQSALIACGTRALFHHGRTITALIELDERARVQGIDLYGSAPKRNRTIHKAVAFMIDAMEDPKWSIEYAMANVHAPSKSYREQDLGSVGSTLGIPPRDGGTSDRRPNATRNRDPLQNERSAVTTPRDRN